MTRSPSAAVKRRLALVRQLYLHGTSLAAGTPTLLRRITSLITLDLAVENALRTIVADLDPSFKIDTDMTYPKLVQHASDVVQGQLGGTLPATSGTGYLHHARNDAQHNGRYPSVDEVAECRAHATTFLTDICAAIWGLTFASISLADLILNEETKALIQAAEEAIAADNFTLAVSKAAAGLSWLMSIAAERLFPRAKTRLWKGIGPIKWNIGLGTPPKPRIDPDTVRVIERIDRDIIDNTRALQGDIKSLREDVEDELDSF